VQPAAQAPAPPPPPPRQQAVPPPPPPVGAAQQATKQATQQAPVQQAVAASHGGSLYEQSVLVVSQKTKLIELTNEYAVFDGQGRQIGAVVEVGQSGVKKALRFVSNFDQFMTHRLEVRDGSGTALVLTRPAKLVKSRVIIADPTGREIGQIVQQNAIGKIRFAIEAGGYTLGSINGENWRAWNFNIRDHTDTEVARITKTWEGLAKTMFTTADNYVVQIHRPLEDPLRLMVVAAALCVDTALKQDSRGFG